MSEVIIFLLIIVCGYLFVAYPKGKSKESEITPDIKNGASETETVSTDVGVVTPPIDREMTSIGYIDGPHGDQTFVIPERDRQNIAVFGEIGSGKTTILRMLIMQDLMRGTGFMLIDPHREFSREVLSMIPKDQQDRVVYISLAALYQFGRTVCINPLQTETEHEKYIRTAGVIDSLKQYFTDGWGHRLETIIRNMMNLVLATPETFKFLDIIQVLFDEDKRASALQKCALPAVRDFWTNVFPKFNKEATGAIYNKFDKIINTPPIAAFFSSAESTVSIREIIEDSKIVIVDLGSAATTDLIEFMGTLLINMFNLENKIRFDLGDAKKTPFNLYIDEVHMFSPSVVRELLNNVRKYGMKVTVATQSVKALDKEFSQEFEDLFRCLVMFRCDNETATLLSKNLPLTTEQLAQLGFHRFAAFSQGFDRIAGIGKTRHIEIPSRWEAVAKKSLEKYGKEIPIESYSFASKKGGLVPEISPIEYFLVNTLYLQRRDINAGELIAAAETKFGLDERVVKKSLIDSLLQHYEYIVAGTDYKDGQNKYETRKSYAITSRAVTQLYSRAFAGKSAGSELHTSVISAIADHLIANYKYCIVDLGDTGGPTADIVVFEFMEKDGKIPTPNGELHPMFWSTNMFTVEVETDPTKHKAQIVTNFTKNKKREMDVCFVVFSQAHKDYIVLALAESDIGVEEYQIVILDPPAIDDPHATAKTFSGRDLDNKQDDLNTPYASLKSSVNMEYVTCAEIMNRLEKMGKDKNPPAETISTSGTPPPQSNKDVKPPNTNTPPAKSNKDVKPPNTNTQPAKSNKDVKPPNTNTQPAQYGKKVMTTLTKHGVIPPNTNASTAKNINLPNIKKHYQDNMPPAVEGRKEVLDAIIGFTPFQLIVDRTKLQPGQVQRHLDALIADGSVELSGIMKRKIVDSLNLTGQHKSFKHVDVYVKSMWLKERALTVDDANLDNKDKNFEVDRDIAYSKMDIAALKVKLDAGESVDAITAELRLRDMDVKFDKYHKSTIFDIQKEIHGHNNMEGKHGVNHK